MASDIGLKRLGLGGSRVVIHDLCFRSEVNYLRICQHLFTPYAFCNIANKSLSVSFSIPPIAFPNI